MKLRHLPVAVLGGLSLLVGALASVQAEPAVFFNSELRIDAAIVHLKGKDMLFKDLILLTMPDGTLQLIYGNKRNLAMLEELELDVVYGDGVEVELAVGGYLSDPCKELEPVAVRREGSVFHVLVAETAPDPWACAQVLQPFSVTVRLDVEGLEPGDYLVLVNNEPMEFTIEDLGV